MKANESKNKTAYATIFSAIMFAGGMGLSFYIMYTLFQAISATPIH
ncbi:hypothetical protein PP175_25750 (plasmid) [Aneurinibacillus sp. Ricciae_BoGa-3]|nr:hypothetical protein [Aneurinibacillus sp. Ricciae_BoGa-3]WCK57473.1 hypothetical protein PP175_25750 [Aneurinibacillus sp. Ricciae_BoGa-3]